MIDEISLAKNICFLGDSVTDGTKNGGFGWYEPLAANFPDKNITRFAKGSETSRWLLANADKIAQIRADLYVIAIGCNDIRYRNPQICAMTAEEYIETLDSLVKTITESSLKARFVFIAPWRSLRFDANFNVASQAVRMEIYEAYTKALALYCKQNGYLFLDPNPLIFQKMEAATVRTSGDGEILKDFIHPNAHSGIAAYSKAVAMCNQIKQQ